MKRNDTYEIINFRLRVAAHRMNRWAATFDAWDESYDEGGERKRGNRVRKLIW